VVVEVFVEAVVEVFVRVVVERVVERWRMGDFHAVALQPSLVIVLTQRSLRSNPKMVGYAVKCFPDGYMKNTYVYFDRFDLHLPSKLRFFTPL
jgi:hypothetical protein